MSNNPVQIVLNDSDFLRMKDAGRGGDPKDFFGGSNAAFVRHKASLISKLESIKEDLSTSRYGPAVFVRVAMRQEALAKSYRPSMELFVPDLFPCAGASAIGVLYYRVASHYIDRLIDSFQKAEESPVLRDRKGRLIPVASRKRSEVGAIAELEVVDAAEKIRFDIDMAVARFQQPATVSGYRVELYEKYAPNTPIMDDLLGHRLLQETFVEEFMKLGRGVRGILARTPGHAGLLEFQLTDDDKPPLLVDQSALATSQIMTEPDNAELLEEPIRHKEALMRLAKHPLVKAIRPPLQIVLSDASVADGSFDETLELEIPNPESSYPAVGVIDSGIKAAPLLPWVMGRHDRLDEDEYDGDHGSKVAGVISAGAAMNPNSTCEEPLGCKIYDIPLFPEDAFLDVFPDGFEELVEEIAEAVATAKREHGVRVFNMSLNLDEVSPTEYGLAAARLDEIADAADVVFVISAGNLPGNQLRSPWQTKPKDVMEYFAGRTLADPILQPAESVRSISVGAINPEGQTHLGDAPTTYTRRGPGLQVGVKPDLCAYGGSIQAPGSPSGLRSCDSNGIVVPVSGTSFAAPIVARTMAGIDHVTQGASSKETLRSLMVHHAEVPYPLTRRGVSKQIGPQFGGFGKTSSASDILQTDDHTITLVFESRLTILEPRPAMLRFPFTWPRSLVDGDGACSGLLTATLVYSPPLDPAFGAEFVRVNLNARMTQRTEKVDEHGEIKESWVNHLKQKGLPNNGGAGLTEKALVKYGLKWWPTKKYGVKLNDKGSTSDWRIEVDSLIRAEADFPAEGIPFSLVVTIADPTGQAPVFSELQRSLGVNANMIDIRSRTQVTVRN